MPPTPPFGLRRMIQYCSTSNIDSMHKTRLNFTWFMPRLSIWKDSFVDAFLLTMKKKRILLFNRQICSHILLQAFHNLYFEIFHFLFCLLTISGMILSQIFLESTFFLSLSSFLSLRIWVLLAIFDFMTEFLVVIVL